MCSHKFFHKKTFPVSSSKIAIQFVFTVTINNFSIGDGIRGDFHMIRPFLVVLFKFFDFLKIFDITLKKFVQIDKDFS